MNKPKRYNKCYLPMLWVGLALWLLSILASAIMDKNGTAPAGQEALFEMGKGLFRLRPVGTVLLLCFFQPILEELSFRLWGVGKRWMTIVGLALMAIFSIGEMGLWGALWVLLFLVVWLAVKDKVVQNWLNAIVTSACFALCHISGFDGFSLGMVLGLTDIFGMALVMCWLAVNVSFGLSCLLHVLNNSLAILLPMLILAKPVTVSTEGSTLSLEPLKAFANNSALLEGASALAYLDSNTTEFYVVGEPAEVASLLAEAASTQQDVYYDWVGRGESLEERVVLRVKYSQPQQPDFAGLLSAFDSMAETFYKGRGLVLDTSTAWLNEIWKLYPNGTEEQVCTTDDPALGRAANDYLLGRDNCIVNERITLADSVTVVRPYCLEHRSVLSERMNGSIAALDQAYGYSIDLRPAREVSLITIK